MKKPNESSQLTNCTKNVSDISSNLQKSTETGFIIHCPECKRIPIINIIDSVRISIECKKCNHKCEEKIENLNSGRSEYTNFDKKSYKCYKDGNNAAKYCTNCNIFLCTLCVKDHIILFSKKNNTEFLNEKLDNKQKIQDCNHILIDPIYIISSKCQKHGSLLRKYDTKICQEICAECEVEENENQEKENQKTNYIKLDTLISEDKLENISQNLEDAKELINFKNKILKNKVIDSLNHEIAESIKEYDIKIKDLKENFNRMIKSLTEKYQKDLKSLSTELKNRINELKQHIKEITESYDFNQISNKKLIAYSELLLSNYKFINGKYNYCIINNLKSNLNFVIKDYQNYPINYVDSLNYFNTNSILKDTPLVEICPRCEGERKIQKWIFNDSPEHTKQRREWEEKWKKEGINLINDHNNEKVHNFIYESEEIFKYYDDVVGEKEEDYIKEVFEKEILTCSLCKGEGYINKNFNMKKCKECQGLGYFDKDILKCCIGLCKSCQGKGYI